jgi:hypothetical protein
LSSALRARSRCGRTNRRSYSIGSGRGPGSRHLCEWWLIKRVLDRWTILPLKYRRLSTLPIGLDRLRLRRVFDTEAPAASFPLAAAYPSAEEGILVGLAAITLCSAAIPARYEVFFDPTTSATHGTQEVSPVDWNGVRSHPSGLTSYAVYLGER